MQFQIKEDSQIGYYVDQFLLGQDKMKIDIIHAGIIDAERLLEFYKNILSETLPFIMRNSVPTLEQERQFIQNHDGENSVILLAVDNDKVIGSCNFRVGGHPQLSHTCFLIGIAVAKNYRGLGVGTKLLTSAENWCIDKSIHRLDFEVVDGNPAIFFYEKLGYQIEGRKRKAIKVQDKFKDLLIMAKVLA
jgi:ribosomal protein S18 acetylase RimI-like enzyme